MDQFNKKFRDEALAEFVETAKTYLDKLQTAVFDEDFDTAHRIVQALSVSIEVVHTGIDMDIARIAHEKRDAAKNN